MSFFQKNIIIPCLICFISCNSNIRTDNYFQHLEEAYNKGDFSIMIQIADSIRSTINDSTIIWRIDSLVEISKRIQIDFSIRDDQITEKINDSGIDYSLSDLEMWEGRNWLEAKIIDGRKWYFNRAVSNLKRILDHQKSLNDPNFQARKSEFDEFKIRHIRKIIEKSQYPGDLVLKNNLRLSYTITVSPDAVPSGELIRCWMPFPRVNHPAQVMKQIVKTDPEIHKVSPGETMHRSIYFEKPSMQNKPVVFAAEMEIATFARYFNIPESGIRDYNKESEVYRQFTSEQYPHIVFSRKIMELSDEIVGGVTNPYEIVKQIFYWIDKNIPWTGALEYSLFSNIPEYVIENMRGDCGMVTLLFMTLARYNGIPVRWQSGWMLHPGNVNLHDWCEVFYEGIGWVPVDVSFGLLPSENLQIREFYISGMDAYRFIVNDNIGDEFFPPKKYFRSEPWDFQRGELEWSGGNIYFDKWKYQMKIDYQDQHLF